MSVHSLVEVSVGDELQQSPIIDVYKVASEIHDDHPELTVNEIAELVSESVIRVHANAVWIAS